MNKKHPLRTVQLVQANHHIHQKRVRLQCLKEQRLLWIRATFARPTSPPGRANERDTPCESQQSRVMDELFDCLKLSGALSNVAPT